ncbi:hypothetical protein ACL9RL_17390 [Plantibacter sp. Mn2098]|uniref:hypothetical protein n=1 Tax=Plantibacter sp. Mn2098 TaxID=3395266 RepID=UPI003BBC6716
MTVGQDGMPAGASGAWGSAGATRAPVLLIDGRSGSGKTSLAAAVAGALTDSTVVHMDDLYPGWDGLDEGSVLLTESVLRPLSAGLPAVWRRWDWHRSERAEAHVVDPSIPLVVEGCGALSRASARLAASSIWLDAPPPMREGRLSRRDGTVEWWPAWTVQEDAFIARERPDALADVVLDGGAASEEVLARALEALSAGVHGVTWDRWLAAR